MTITERHKFILQHLYEKNEIDIGDLSQTMQVSGVTIRKDLKVLEEKGLLYRTKGGASVSNPYANERPINEKEFINVDQKKKIARAALKIVSETNSIIIGSGTTVFELSRCLTPTRRLFVITPALKVALELYNRPNIEVLHLGGLIHSTSGSSAGTFAERVLDEISCDILFLGVDGIDLEFGLTITNLVEASLNQKMIKIARKVVIMADSSKFGKRGLGRICGIDQIHTIVTDSGIPSSIKKTFEERGVEIIIAD